MMLTACFACTFVSQWPVRATAWLMLHAVGPVADIALSAAGLSVTRQWRHGRRLLPDALMSVPIRLAAWQATATLAASPAP